jgi:hypothetical protein
MRGVQALGPKSSFVIDAPTDRGKHLPTGINKAVEVKKVQVLTLEKKAPRHLRSAHLLPV